MEWMLMPLKRYAEFSGRSRRMEYWMFTLGVFLLYLAMFTVVMMIGFSAIGAASSGPDGAARGLFGMFASLGIFALAFGVIWLGLLIPTLAVMVRRLHDTNKSGWFLFIYIGPYLISMVLNVMAVTSNSMALSGIAGVIGLLGFVGAIVLLVFFCLPGTAGPNNYGPDPINPAADLSETFR
jgi:uncharacterized membrane protein YhaH (DUF805 family)